MFVSGVTIIGGLLLLGDSAAPAANDPYFQYVSLLLNDSGINGAQNSTFLDNSTNNFTITRSGAPTQGSLTPYWTDGQWSNYFDGSSYITSPDLAITGDFTIELYVNISEYSPLSIQYSPVITFGDENSADGFAVWFDHGNFAIGNSNITLITDAGLSPYRLGNWYHLAIVRSSGTLKFAINGVFLSTTASLPSATGSTPIRIGQEYYGGPYANLTGYISNLRAIKGTAIYSTDFTPPTTRLTAISGTALLTCQSNRFKDNSSNNYALTLTGTPSVQPFEPFEPSASYSTATYGGSQLNNSTTNDYLSIASDPAVAIGTGAFTYETWFYPFSFNQISSAGDTLFIVNVSSGLQIGKRDGVGGNSWGLASAGVAWRLTTTTQPINYAWNHIAVVRSGTGANLTSIFLNGVRVANGTVTDAFAQGIATIGGGPQAGATEINGYLSNMRLVKGTAVYDPSLTTLTVPTTPVTAITGTSILLNATNAGIYDAASQTDITTVGDAKVSTTQAKWGGSSLAFDGTGDWLTFIDSPVTRFDTGNFTIEGWIYLSTTGTAKYIAAKGTSTTGWAFGINSSNKLVFDYTTSTLTGTTTLSTGTWYHVAVTRYVPLSYVSIYLNGVVEVSSVNSVSDDFSQTNTGYIGADRTGSNPMNGYIDDLRITNGYARYAGIAPFTPPTASFPTR